MRKPKGYGVQFSILALIFFMWGFVTVMNDILIPHLKHLFHLDYLRSMLVQFCFFGAYFIGSSIYFIVSYYTKDPINSIGYKNSMLGGVLISAIGCGLFYPAATLSIYALFLIALFVLGLGFTILQIVSNPYVSLLGEEKSASSRLNLAQALNSLGTTLAPILGGFLIFKLFAIDGGITPESTRVPYLIFAGIFLLLWVLIYSIKFPSFKSKKPVSGSWGALAFPQLKLGILGIFFYVGAEVTIGSFMISYLEQPQIMNFSQLTAKNYLALYWGGAMVGRFLGAISLNHHIPGLKKAAYMVGTALLAFVLIFSIVNLDFKQINIFLILIALSLVGFLIGKALPARTLCIFAVINILLVLTSIFSAGQVAMWTIIGVGLFNSIMWSNIFTISIAGLREYASQGSSLLIMAILGAALIPLIQGATADAFGIQYSYFVPVFCYLFIAFFGLYCFRMKENQQAKESGCKGYNDN